MGLLLEQHQGACTLHPTCSERRVRIDIIQLRKKMQNYIHTCYIPHQIYIQIIFANGWVGARRTLACQISGSISIPKERREHWILNTFGAIRLNQPVLVLFAVFHVEKNRFLWGKNSERKHSQKITHASSILVHESSTKRTW